MHRSIVWIRFRAIVRRTPRVHKTQLMQLRDLGVYHALRELQSVKPGAGIKKSTSFFRIKGTFSGGTMQTLVDLSSVPLADRGGEWSLISRSWSLLFV